MFLNGFSIGNVFEFLKWHISQLVAPIEVLFVTSPLGFGKLHDDVNVFAIKRSYRKLLKK